MATNISDFGNGVGLLYITENDGTTFLSPGISNDKEGVNIVKNDALTKAPIAYEISAKGKFRINILGVADSVFLLTINGVSQITNTVVFPLGTTREEAIELVAAEVNSTIPISGANYQAIASGANLILQAPSSFGDSVNGDVVAVNPFGAGNSWVTEDVSGGSNGNGKLSSVNGARYFMDSQPSAAVSVISSNAIEITDYVVMRGVQSQHVVHQQNIASKAISNLERYDRFSVLELGTSGVTDLDSITGDFAKNDILILSNKSPFAITVKDISLTSGNIKINPESFEMIDDNYVLWVQYQEDDVDGLVWREIYRNPTTLAANSVTDVELANLSVGTPEIKDLAVTTAKMALASVDDTILAANSVIESKISNNAVTESKIIDNAVTENKIQDDAVTESKIVDGAVTNDKLAAGSISIDKLDATLNKDQVVVPISWETGEQGLFSVKMPACTVNDIFISVNKEISAGDDATFLPKNDAGTVMSNGTIDLPASTPFGNNFTSSPTGDSSFAEGETMKFETSKTTPGGKGIVTVTYTKS